MHVRGLRTNQPFRESYRTCKPEFTEIPDDAESRTSAGDSHSDDVQQSTKISCLYDEISKTRACEILSESIPSLCPSLITRCVFSQSERSKVHTWALTTRGSRPDIISTVVFRRHARLSFVELIYIATATGSRGDGFGKYFLQSMIDKWLLDSMSHVITHADLSAVPFFEKMGFSTTIPFPRDFYEPWVDKYSKSVLMCLSLYEISIPRQISKPGGLVKVLIQMDNVDKYAKEIWVDGFVIHDNEDVTIIQYSYQQRTYNEVLPVESIRLKDYMDLVDE